MLSGFVAFDTRCSCEFDDAYEELLLALLLSVAEEDDEGELPDLEVKGEEVANWPTCSAERTLASTVSRSSCAMGV
jgi:hypothetical protein